MIFVDLLIVALLTYAAYGGYRRGAVLVGFELFGFVTAFTAALMAYHPLGLLLKNVAGITISLANVAAFIMLWIFVELGVALVTRYKAMPRLPMSLRALSHSPINGASGAILNGIKTLILVTLAVTVYAGLPLTGSLKNDVTGAYIPRAMIASTGQLQGWVAAGLGHDLGDSLNFFTVTNDPESTEHIDLGFTTTDVKIDEADEAAMLVLVNHERTSRGLAALRMNPVAVAVARDHSRDMLARGYFSHVTPEGKTPFDRMRAGHVNFVQAGENLAFAPTLSLAHQGLMNSPGHKANILSPNYKTVGIGIIDAGQYGLMITQDFTD